MTHPRTELRNAIQALLIAAGTTAGSNVFASRSERLSSTDGAGTELPAIIITSLDEEPDRINEAPKVYRRNQVMAVDVFVDDSGLGEDYADKLDVLCEEIEAALFTSGDQFLAALTAKFWPSHYMGTELFYEDDSEELLAFARLKWEFPFETDASEVQTPAFSDFTKAHTDWDVSQVDPATDEAQDDVDLPVA